MKLDANGRLALKLFGAAVAMFGFGYALVPLYDTFCEVTGLGGKTGRISIEQAAAAQVDENRVVTVEFDTNVNPNLPWRFQSAARRMEVRPGELSEAVFYAENTSDHSIVGQAIPSMAPAEASIYFNKTECFCFRQQTLAPGERRAMPVRFVVDPELPGRFKTMTLSYTFFASPQGTARGSQASTNNNSDERS